MRHHWLLVSRPMVPSPLPSCVGSLDFRMHTEESNQRASRSLTRSTSLASSLATCRCEFLHLANKTRLSYEVSKCDSSWIVSLTLNSSRNCFDRSRYPAKRRTIFVLQDNSRGFGTTPIAVHPKLDGFGMRNATRFQWRRDVRPLSATNYHIFRLDKRLRPDRLKLPSQKQNPRTR